jgi:hypothetical protein
MTDTTTYKLYCFRTYFRDSPTGGTAGEDVDGKHWYGDSDPKLFETPAEAWAWLGIDPQNLPADEVVEGDSQDDQYTRTYRWAKNGDLMVRDIPATTFWASSRIVSRTYSVIEVK